MNRLDFYTSITPSTRQLEIQSLGFYAFLHFGMNTFLDKEWSDGKASPSFFARRSWIRINGCVRCATQACAVRF